MNEHGADGLALVDTTGDGEDEDGAAVRPGVLSALVGDRDNPAQVVAMLASARRDDLDLCATCPDRR